MAKRLGRFGRLVLACVVALQVTPALAQDEPQEQDPTATLPILSNMRVPTPQQLLDQIEPLDWIVLKKNAQGEFPVLVAEGVPERPNTIEVYQQKKIRKIDIIVPEVGIAELQLPITAIDHIVYAEEQMLMAVDMLLENPGRENLEIAFELVSVVERRIPSWDKTEPRLQRLLFLDAKEKRARNEPELALALLEESHAVNSQYPGVQEMVGEIINELVGKAVQEQDFRKAQHFLARSGETFSDHPARQQWLQRLEQMASGHYQKADELFTASQFAEAAAEVQQGNRIWRARGESGVIYRKVLSRYQQVHVGVTSLGQKFPITTSAQRRQRELAESRLFEPDRAESVVYYDTAFFEQWEPLDLGRRVVFTLRKTQPHWSGLPPITSPNIIDTLKARLDPENPAYDERFSSYIEEFLVQSPHEFEIRFSRIPLRIESLFAFPLTSADGELYSRRFTPGKTTEESISFTRTHPEPDELSAADYHVAEVIEHKFEQSHQAIQALQRNEIQMIAHLQPWEIDAFETSNLYYRRKYALPFVHVIQFNPQTEILTNPQVRRALSKAIDRERILKNVVLRDDAMRHGRVVASPWPSQSYASSSLVEAPEYDLAGLRTAAALRSTAEMVLKADAETEEEKKGPPKTRKLPTLRLLLEEDPVIELAAQDIMKFWKAAGFEVQIVPSTDDPNGWDLVYHKVKLNEPLTDLWPFLTLSDKAEVTGLLSLPDWLKQSMVDLDFTANFPAAEANLKLLHRHLSAQGFFIPLWEVDDYAVFSIHMSGFSNEPVKPYQQVTRWAIRPVPGG